MGKVKNDTYREGYSMTNGFPKSMSSTALMISHLLDLFVVVTHVVFTELNNCNGVHPIVGSAQHLAQHLSLLKVDYVAHCGPHIGI